MLGPRIGIGYDIGCSFLTTILNSSLGDKFRELLCYCGPNAFHASSHSANCQKKNHPNVIEGMGLEDLEEMERVFSASNPVASLTRHASPFHRHQAIENHWDQWGEDKYINLGTMLFNNYVQALDIINTDTPALHEALTAFGYSEDDLKRFHEEQIRYTEQLGEGEAAWDVHAMTYVTLLREHAALK